MERESSPPQPPKVGSRAPGRGRGEGRGDAGPGDTNDGQNKQMAVGRSRSIDAFYQKHADWLGAVCDILPIGSVERFGLQKSRNSKPTSKYLHG